MTPSIETRLISVVHGLRDVIFPAVNPNESLAMEQCGLILSQLNMLIHQMPYANRYHQMCLDDLRGSVEDFPATAEGGERTRQAAAALGEALAHKQTDPFSDYQRICAAFDALILVVPMDGAEDYRRKVEAAAFAFAKRQNGRERIWFKESGFDPAASELQSLAELFDGA